MGLDDLAQRLANRDRIGMTPELADRLKIRAADAVRGQLMSMMEGDAGPLGVYMLGVYVVDDTDFWGDGEIYWWSIPVLADAAGKVGWSALSGLPAGARPHKVGSLEWMTSFSLNEPPLIAVIPPGDEASACVVRLAFYDDDGAAADMPAAMTEGYTALAGCLGEGLSGPEQIITPVRDAIWKRLRAEQDDILIDENVTIRRAGGMCFNAGLIGSVLNSMIRIYYLVRDEARTEQFGPVALHKGQTEQVRFKTPLERGGRLCVFSRGGDVQAAAFGDLTTDSPFINRVLDERTAPTLASGFSVSASGPAKLVAFYTPP
jgi:hypothetical protein